MIDGYYLRWDSKFRRGLSGTTVKVKGENQTVALDPYGHRSHCSIGKRLLPNLLVSLTVTHTALAILFSLGISWIGVLRSPLGFGGIPMSKSEGFGELDDSSERTADIRVPQQAELLVTDLPLFNELITNRTGFGVQVAIILTQRLVSTLEDLPDSESKKELQGELEYFDLATVVQTLISSAQTGVMTLSSDKVALAQFFFQSGNIYRATDAVTKPFTTCFKRSRKASFSSAAKARKTSRTDQPPESLCPRWR